jgi:hypothetical protein
MKIESDSSGTRVFATIPLPKDALSEDQGNVDSLGRTVPDVMKTV